MRLKRKLVEVSDFRWGLRQVKIYQLLLRLLGWPQRFCIFIYYAHFYHRSLLYSTTSKKYEEQVDLKEDVISKNIEDVFAT